MESDRSEFCVVFCFFLAFYFVTLENLPNLSQPWFPHLKCGVSGTVDYIEITVIW